MILQLLSFLSLLEILSHTDSIKKENSSILTSRTFMFLLCMYVLIYLGLILGEGVNI